MNKYLTYSAAKLVEVYCFEHGRNNEEDREQTQRLVKRELRKRFEAMLTLLDSPELADHPERIYEYFARERSSSK